MHISSFVLNEVKCNTCCHNGRVGTTDGRYGKPMVSTRMQHLHKLFSTYYTTLECSGQECILETRCTILVFKEGLGSIDDIVIQPGLVAFKNNNFVLKSLKVKFELNQYKLKKSNLQTIRGSQSLQGGVFIPLALISAAIFLWRV